VFNPLSFSENRIGPAPTFLFFNFFYF
jgi:hypothetical protein